MYITRENKCRADSWEFYDSVRNKTCKHTYVHMYIFIYIYVYTCILLDKISVELTCEHSMILWGIKHVNIHMYICIYIYIYICIYMYITIENKCRADSWEFSDSVSNQTCKNTYVHMYIFIDLYIHIYITRENKCRLTREHSLTLWGTRHVNIHVYLCTYVYMCTYMYIHVYYESK